MLLVASAAAAALPLNRLPCALSLSAAAAAAAAALALKLLLRLVGPTDSFVARSSSAAAALCAPREGSARLSARLSAAPSQRCRRLFAKSPVRSPARLSACAFRATAAAGAENKTATAAALGVRSPELRLGVGALTQREELPAQASGGGGGTRSQDDAPNARR